MIRLLITTSVFLWLIMQCAQAQPSSDHDNQEYVGNFISENDDQLPRSEVNQQHHKRIQEILGNKDFGHKKTVTQWRWIDTQDKVSRQEKVPDWLITIIEIIERLDGPVTRFSTFLEVLLWILAGLLIAYFLIKYRENIKYLITNFNQTQNEQSMPTTLFGLDIKKESLPEDIPATATKLWQQGESRQAIALLLQGSLIRLILDHNVRLVDSDTENECCAQIDEQAPDPKAHYMRELVSVWQAIAYAHRRPSKEKFTHLNQRWEEMFSAK